MVSSQLMQDPNSHQHIKLLASFRSRTILGMHDTSSHLGQLVQSSIIAPEYITIFNALLLTAPLEVGKCRYLHFTDKELTHRDKTNLPPGHMGGSLWHSKKDLSSIPSSTRAPEPSNHFPALDFTPSYYPVDRIPAPLSARGQGRFACFVGPFPGPCQVEGMGYRLQAPLPFRAPACLNCMQTPMF